MDLQTDRLSLVPFSRELAQPLAKLYTDDWPNLAPWSPERDAAFFTTQGQLERLSERIEEAKEASFAAYVKESGELIGTVEVTEIVRGPLQQAFLGYWIAASAGGRGYATEAVKRVADYAFEDLGLHRLEAGIMPRNVRSIRVIEKAGFRCEGVSHSFLQIAGVWEDMLRYVRFG
jgi:ribosomal-protein-alanine N-acetyltransferase